MTDPRTPEEDPGAGRPAPVELRYLLAVVSRAGGGVGREVALALSRQGAGVLCVDPDRHAAAQTASVVRQARVGAWELQADLAEEADARLLLARLRDLGGADLVVTHDETHARWVADEVLADARDRPRRRAGTPAVVVVGGSAPVGSGPQAPSGARVMAVHAGAADPATARGVVALLARGRDREVATPG